MAEKDIKWSEELGSKLCDHIAEGGSIKSACAEHGISRVAFYNWIREKENFREQVDIAQQNRAVTHVDQLFEIAKDESMDVQTRRLLSDNIKWAAAKMYRNQFGDKLEVNNKHLISEVPKEELLEELTRQLKGSGIDISELLDGEG